MRTVSAVLISFFFADVHATAASGRDVADMFAGADLTTGLVRVTDSSTPPHVVLGAQVVFQDLIGRLPADEPIVWAGEAGIFQPSMPVILGKSQVAVASDMNGLASFPISIQGFSGNIVVIGSAAAGSASLPFAAQQLGP